MACEEVTTWLAYGKYTVPALSWRSEFDGRPLSNGGSILGIGLHKQQNRLPTG
jgi:hypothetical protein